MLPSGVDVKYAPVAALVLRSGFLDPDGAGVTVEGGQLHTDRPSHPAWLIRKVREDGAIMGIQPAHLRQRLPRAYCDVAANHEGLPSDGLQA